MGFASTAMGATQLGLNLVGDYLSWKDQKENAKAQARALSQRANAVGKNLAYTFQNYEFSLETLKDEYNVSGCFSDTGRNLTLKEK